MPTTPFNALTTGWDPTRFTNPNGLAFAAWIVSSNNMEGSYNVYLPRVNVYDRADTIKPNGYSGTGMHIPIMPGQAVVVTPQDGNSSRLMIVGTIDYAPNLAKQFQEGMTGCPNNTDENGRPVSFPVCNQFVDDIKNAGLNTQIIANMITPIEFSDGTKATEALSGFKAPGTDAPSEAGNKKIDLPMETFPGASINLASNGDLNVNVPGILNFSMAEVNFNTISPPVPMDEWLVQRALEHERQIENFKTVNGPWLIDKKAGKFSKLEGKTYAVGRVGSTPFHDEYMEEVQRRAEEMTAMAEEEAEELQSFEDICVAALTALLEGDWGTLFDLAVDFAKKEVLPQLNEALPDFLQMGFGEDGGFNIGPMSMGEDGSISFDTGQVFSMASQGLDQINQFLPDFLQMGIEDGQLNLGNLASVGLGGLTGTTDLNGMEINASNAPGGFDVKWGNVVSAGVEFGLGELNKHLPDDAQVSIAECDETQDSTATPFAIESEVNDDRYCIGNISVGDVSYDPTTGNVSAGSENSGEGFLSNLLGGLPPPFSRAARLVFERINMQELFSGNFDEAFAELDLKAIAIQLICGLLEGGEDNNSALPRLVTPSASAVSGLPSRSAQNLYQELRPTRPHRYVRDANSRPRSIPLAQGDGLEQTLITYDGLDFPSDPSHGVASLLTQFGLDRGGAIANGLADFTRNHSLHGLQDVIQNGTTPGLFNGFSALNAALDRTDKPRELIQAEIDNVIPTSCSGVAELKDTVATADIDKAIAFIVFGMGYPEFKYTEWVQNPLTMLDWAILAEPDYAVAFNALKSGDFTSFLVELLRLQTGHDLDQYPMGRANLQAWVDRAYTPSVTGHIYP